MGPMQMDQLFVYCDVDGSGAISEKELGESWEFLVATMMEAAAQNVGIGTTDIVFSCILICGTFALLLCFLFLALQGWYNESSFDSMVQAVMVSGSGRAMKSLRSRVAAEGDEDAVNSTVGDLFE